MQGQTAVLRPIVEGRLSLLEAYEAWQRQELHAAEPAEYNARARRALDTWLEAATYKPRTRAGITRVLEWVWRQVPASARDAAGEPNVRVRELPALLQGFRESTNYATFHTLRSALQAYARDEFEQSSALWKGITAVPELERPVARQMKKRAPLVMPLEARLVRQTLATNCKSHKRAEGAEAARLFWLSCMTGMGPQEMFVDGFGLVPDEGVAIHGQKTKHRARVVPQILPDALYAPPTISRDCYENRLERARRFIGIDVTPYSGRRAFAHWEEAAAIPHSRRRSHLGHEAGSMTTHYLLEVKPYLDFDGDALIAYVTDSVRNPPRRAMSGATRVFLQV